MRKRRNRQTVDRIENILIAILACSALFLIYQSGLIQSITSQGTRVGNEILFTGVQDTALSRGTPVRLMVQTEAGRYGVQYDEETVDGLYGAGLGDLLIQSIDAMESVKTSTQEDWQQAITQGNAWVYYDFLYNVSFTSQSSRGEGEGRRFLITARERPGRCGLLL